MTPNTEDTRFTEGEYRFLRGRFGGRQENRGRDVVAGSAIQRVAGSATVLFALITACDAGVGVPVSDGKKQVLFHEDFRSGMKRWQVRKGDWRTVEGLCVSAGPGLCAARSPAWKDFSLEVRLKTDEPGKNPWDVGAVMFRFTPRKNAFGGDYYYLLLHKNNNLELGRRVEGKQLRGGLAHFREVPPGTEWNRLRVELRGRYIRVFVNDVLAIERVDPDPISKGGIGLLNLGARRCRFDDIRVTTVGPVQREPAPDWPGRNLRLSSADKDRTDTVVGGWPTYGHGPTRSSVTTDRLTPPLRLRWSYRPLHGPRPAWPEPGKEVQRLSFDAVFHVAVDGGLVCFGSSADCQVHALDADTGRERWNAFTEGPVRFAPVIVGDRVFAASDDGCVYCFSTENGAVLWRFHGGPRTERLVGNDRVISRWPVRSGVLVDEGVVYFAAGMWSSDGVYVYALRAADGSVLWVNDTCGQLYMKLPHDYLEGIAGVSPQGYMLLSGNALVIPNGRAMPAAFDRRTGKLLYCRNAASKLHHPGGSWNVVAGDLIIGERHPLQDDRHSREGPSDYLPGDGLIAWSTNTGDQILAIAGKHRALIHGGVAYLSGSGRITAIETATLFEKAGAFYSTGSVDPDLTPEDVHPMPWWRGARYPWYPSRIVPIAPTPARWETAAGRTYALALAGNVLVTGEDGRVRVLDTRSGKVLWKVMVRGRARGLASAGGRLYVSTTTGDILCFDAKSGNSGRQVKESASTVRVPAAVQARAAAALACCGVRKGYALLLGPGSGGLALELARTSQFDITCLEADAADVRSSREFLARAGVYGDRATVHHGDLRQARYADYFANFVLVSDASTALRRNSGTREIYRLLHPWGGVAVVLAGNRASAVAAAFRAASVPDGEIHVDGPIVSVVRGPLAGAGAWTHEYGDAARSCASKDTRVRLPLEMLWFGGPGPAETVSRHWRAPAPLFVNGRLFICGENCLMAVDAYNGHRLWTYNLPGIARWPARYRGGNIVADADSVYAVKGTRCLRFDARTGSLLHTFSIPVDVSSRPVPKNPVSRARGGKAAGRPEPNAWTWEYLAVTDSYVLGSVGVPNFVMSWWPEADPECSTLFALNKRTGQSAWVYPARESVSPNAVAIAGDRLWLLDRRADAAFLRAKRRGRQEKRRAMLRCLNLASGALVWELPVAPEFKRLCAGNGVVLASRGRGIAAWNAADGKSLWKAPFRSNFPVIMGDTVYVYPGAYDLRTGRPRETEHPLTQKQVPWRTAYKGGCGAVTGCRDALFFRSGASGMVDLHRDSGVHWLGQVRPSCWINMVPAGGMLLIPEGAGGCTCPYNYQTSLAMVANHDRSTADWAVYPEQRTQAGERLRRARLNFGAVGDRRDEARRLWLAWPRPFRPGGQFVPLNATGPIRFFRRNPERTPVAGTSRPWLYTSGCEGAVRYDLSLALDRPVPALRCPAPPRVDGRLDDSCWDGRSTLHFTDDRQVRAQGTDAWLRADSKALYIAFRREAPVRDGKPIPWVQRTKGTDAPVWRDDSLNIRLRRGLRREGLYLSVSASGASFDGHSVHRIGTDPGWDGAWEHAVHTVGKEWTAEIAVPWKTLGSVGIDRKNIAVYFESDNATGVGPKQVHYRYRPYTRLWCFAHRFVPVTFQPPARLDPHLYDLTLHFVEPDAMVRPGERVFDIKLNGKMALSGVDPVRDAGGTKRALIHTLHGVALRNRLLLELVPHGKRPPILCAIELQDRTGATSPPLRE